MTEPREIAQAAEEVAPGLWHWRISNRNIGGHVSSSQALLTREGCLLVDPVRLDDAALGALPRPTATLLTARCHQRAAWRYRDELGAAGVVARGRHRGRRAAGPHLRRRPGCCRAGCGAFRTPGPEWPHYSFLYEGDPGIVFCSDLLSSDEAGLHFIDPAYHEDPEATRKSVEALLDLPFGILCFAHGAPVLDDPKAALRKALDQAS